MYLLSIKVFTLKSHIFCPLSSFPIFREPTSKPSLSTLNLIKYEQVSMLATDLGVSQLLPGLWLSERKAKNWRLRSLQKCLSVMPLDNLVTLCHPPFLSKIFPKLQWEMAFKEVGSYRVQREPRSLGMGGGPWMPTPRMRAARVRAFENRASASPRCHHLRRPAPKRMGIMWACRSHITLSSYFKPRNLTFAAWQDSWKSYQKTFLKFTLRKKTAENKGALWRIRTRWLFGGLVQSPWT